jgi:hypothetical protein
MTRAARAWQRVIDAAARCLSERDADAVLGDLAEHGITGAAALRDVMSLVFRRHAALWRSWQPWAAGFGVALPSALLAMGGSLTLCRDVSEALVSGHTLVPGGAPMLAGIGLRATLLAVWAWTCGCCVSTLSQRTISASSVLAVLPCVYCLSRYHSTELPFTSLLLLIPVLLAGARRSNGRVSSRTTFAIARAAAVSGGALLLGGIAVWWTWPAWYLALGPRQAVAGWGSVSLRDRA